MKGSTSALTASSVVTELRGLTHARPVARIGLRSETDFDQAPVDRERVNGTNRDRCHARKGTGDHAGSHAPERLVEPHGPSWRVRRGDLERDPVVPVRPLA